jgi:hypothetical protein
MWAQERYSLYPAEWRKRHSLLEETVKFGTICGIHSAASHFWILDMLQTKADRFTFGFKDQPLLVDACSPTDQVAYTFYTEGMRRRLGDHAKPSVVLTGKHMRWLERHYSSCRQPSFIYFRTLDGFVVWRRLDCNGKIFAWLNPIKVRLLVSLPASA